MANRTKSLVGLRFGKLLVESKAGISPSCHSLWLCQCDCGGKKIILRKSLTAGLTKSCGCLQKEHIKNKFTKHGYSPKAKITPTYRSWAGMCNRCKNPNIAHYKCYGGRGITMHSSWNLFENFLKDMGECPQGYTLDRIDVNGNYEPSNCRWATKKEQSNNRRNNRILNFNGETRNVTQWAEYLKISPNVLAGRLHRGWPIEKVLEI